MDHSINYQDTPDGRIINEAAIAAEIEAEHAESDLLWADYDQLGRPLEYVADSTVQNPCGCYTDDPGCPHADYNARQRDKQADARLVLGAAIAAQTWWEWE